MIGIDLIPSAPSLTSIPLESRELVDLERRIRTPAHPSDPSAEVFVQRRPPNHPQPVSLRQAFDAENLVARHSLHRVHEVALYAGEAQDPERQGKDRDDSPIDEMYRMEVSDAKEGTSKALDDRGHRIRQYEVAILR